MASKVYTAHEMRYAADVREAWGDKDEVNNMLRQAADMIEREAAKDTAVERLREIVEGLIKASTVECASCDYDCGQNRENCIILEAAKYIEEGEVKR